MRLGQQLMVGLALNAALVAGVQAGPVRPVNSVNSVSNGPYSAILARNVFDLQQPPKPGSAPPPPAALPNVKLIGLLDTSGHPQAVFSISEPGVIGKTPIPCIMSVGQMQSGVEVLAIDLDTKTARIKMGENITIINLEEPKGSQGGSSAVVAGPGMGLGAGARSPTYPPNRPGFVTGPSGFSNPSLPGAYNPNAGGEPNAALMGGATAVAGEGTIPNRQVRSDPSVPVEQQVQNIEIQRQQLIDAGRADIADQILPITSASSQETLNRVLMPGNSATDPSSQGQQQPGTTTAPAKTGPAWGGPRTTGTLRLPGGGQ
jgi:hypothetical protein